MTKTYETIEVLVTLRCNARCRNCIRLCQSEDATGLDYSGLDMTAAHIEHFIAEMQGVASSLRARRGGKVSSVTPLLVITGGEPLLHKEIKQFAQLLHRELVVTGCVGRLAINSNLTINADHDIRPWVENYTPLSEKARVHSAVLLHPDDIPAARPSFAKCNHYRKWRCEYSVHGFSLCCAAGGYLRLFGFQHLYRPTLPVSPQWFSQLGMDDVCQHCPFGTGGPKSEHDVGRPVSAVYSEQAALNRAAGGCRLKPLTFT